jgi:ketosteroid isomerase-like protein
MYLNDLPKPIQAFLDATQKRDPTALLSAFTDEAVLVDTGKEHRGAEIRRWNDELYLGANVRVHPIHAEERGDDLVVTVAVDGDYKSYGVTEPFQLDWHFGLRDGRVARLHMVEQKLDLPKPVLHFVQALNAFDLDGAVATFAEDALVNDQQRDHWRRAAIREWLAREIIADHVTMYMTESRKHADGRCFLVAKVTGTYDKAGLPDPLTLRFYFSVTGDLLTQLIIMPSQ